MRSTALSVLCDVGRCASHGNVKFILHRADLNMALLITTVPAALCRAVSVWVYHCLVEWPSGRFSVRCLCRGWRACRGLRKVMTLNRVFRSWAVKQWPKIKKNDLGNWTLGRCKTAECVVETPSAELITFSNSIFMHSLSWSFLFTIFPERHFVKSWSLFCHKCLDRLHKYEVTHFFVHQFSIFVNNVSHKRAKSY